MQIIETKEMSGELSINVIRAGKVAESWTEHNLIVDLGKYRMAELLAGTSTQHIGFVGVGEGTEDPSVFDTGLTNAQYVNATPQAVGNKAQFSFTIGTDQANGLKISEFGLFGIDKQIFSRRLRKGVIEKDDETEIEGVWTIKL